MKKYILSILLSTFSIASVQAGIFADTGEDPDVIIVRARNAAKPYVQVCQIRHIDGSCMGCGSGALIKKDGHHVWILSAAHVFVGEGYNAARYCKLLYPVAAVRFVDENNNNFHGLIQQVFMPSTAQKHLRAGEKRCGDIAIVKAKMQTDLPFEPMKLHDQDGFNIENKLIKSFFIGFGRYGVNKKEVRYDSKDRHLGPTQVLLFKDSSAGNYPTLMSHVCVDSDYYKTGGVVLPLSADTTAFDQTKPCSIPFNRKTVKIQPLKDQARIASGDSGGPLMVHTKQGLQIIGVNVSGCSLKIFGLSDDNALGDMFEPVMHYGRWINRLLKGDYQEPITRVYNYNTHFRVMAGPLQIKPLTFKDGTKASYSPNDGWTFEVSPGNESKLVKTADKIAYGEVSIDLSLPMCENVDYLMAHTTGVVKKIKVRPVDIKKSFEDQLNHYYELRDHNKTSPILPSIMREFLYVVQYYAQKKSKQATGVLPVVLNDLGSTLVRSAFEWGDNAELQVALLHEGEHYLRRAAHLNPIIEYKKKHSDALINLGAALMKLNWPLETYGREINYNQEGFQVFKRGINPVELGKLDENYMRTTMIQATYFLHWSKAIGDMESKIDIQREVVQFFKGCDHTLLKKYDAEMSFADAHYNLACSLYHYSLAGNLSEQKKANTYKEINALLETCMKSSSFDDAKKYLVTFKDLTTLQNLVDAQPKRVSSVKALHAVVLKERAREENPRSGHDRKVVRNLT